MSYLVFARKYRPQTFDEVVQQEHVTRTLANAISAGRVSHAILFTGPRGTGKTTIARILAKSMNCAQGPTATPCNVCRSCQEIAGSHAADVFEIDGASNNSVDQVRELRENLKYMPAHSRFKIYIIDEVHMLSLAAFNALLKTLEEPPDHVMFIFATTEVHKIPVTILSRCQRHDLRRIDMAAIVENMRRICDHENVRIDDAGLGLVAQEAGGSMRDALSLLDHVLTCAQDGVTAQLVAEMLGAAERKHLFELSAAVFKRDIAAVLSVIDGVWRHGLEIRRFYADLLVHFYHLSVVNIGDHAGQLVDLPAHEVQQLKTQAQSIPSTFLLQILDLLFEAEPSIRMSSQPKMALEIVFMKVFQTPPVLPIETLIEKLDQLRTAEPFVSTSTPVLETESTSQEVLPVQKNQEEQPASKSGTTPPPVNEEMSIPGKEDKTEELCDVSIDSATMKSGSQIEWAQLWQALVTQVQGEKPSLAAFLNKCQIAPAVDQRMAVEVCGNQFTYNSIQKHLDYLESVCTNIANQRIQIYLTANCEDETEKLKARETAERLRQKALSHPLVMSSLELFNGKVVDVKLP